MIDTFSLLLSHVLLFFLIVRLVVHPDLNGEPEVSGRHYKLVGPRAIKEDVAQETGRNRGAGQPGPTPMNIPANKGPQQGA